MQNLKKVGLVLLDFVEVFLPVVALTVIFLAFIVNVISRYVLNAPVNACYELCLGGLVWCLLLSAPYAARKHNNVAFTLLYDNMNPAVQLVMRLIGNGFLIFCFAVMLYPCYDWVAFMHRKYTPVLKIRMDFLYSAFVIFNVLVLAHLIFDFVKDVRLGVLAATGKQPLVPAKESTAADQADTEGGTAS